MNKQGYHCFSSGDWASLKRGYSLALSEQQVRELHGINEFVSLSEVEDVYMPLSRYLSLHFAATRSLSRVTDHFLGGANENRKAPYIIGIAGSVAVGKSTTARLLQALLGLWDERPVVQLVTTDGFLYQNAELEEKGLMEKKGFPESYDVRSLIKFLAAVKSGDTALQVPAYSHLRYDVLSDESFALGSPDIVIVEGLNVLQGQGLTGKPYMFVSDFFDFSIFVDAEESSLKQWYLDRFLSLRETAFKQPESYFYSYSKLSDADAIKKATDIWEGINKPNLFQNILPTRERANLVLTKLADHRLSSVSLRPMW